MVLRSTNSLIIDDDKDDEDDDDKCMYRGAKVGGGVGVGQRGSVPRLAGLRTSLICWSPNLLGSKQLP